MRDGVVIHVQTLGRRDGGPATARPEGECLATGKTRFATEDDALSQALEWAGQNRFRAHSRSAYPCPACGGFHLSRRL